MTWTDINALLLRILRRWYVVLAVTALVLGVTAWRLAETPEQHRATTFLVVGANTELAATDILRVADLLNRPTVMATITDVLSSPRVLGQAYRALPPDSDFDRFGVRVVREPDSNVIRLIVNGPDQASTALLANSMFIASEEAVAELYPIYAITSLSGDQPRIEQIGLPWTRSIALAAFVGLSLGAIIALWFDSLMAYRRTVAALRAERSRSTSSVGSAWRNRVWTRPGAEQSIDKHAASDQSS